MTSVLVNGSQTLPMLMEDQSRLDWAKARYQAAVALKDDVCQVVHRITDAPELEVLLESGDASYVTEVRIPRALSSRMELSGSLQQRLQWQPDERNDDLYLIPGIVATRNTLLPASGLHPFVGNGNETIPIPKGCWLARGLDYSIKPMLVNLLKFVKDKEGILGDGEVSVAEVASVGNPYFQVTLSEALYEQRLDDRNVQIGALIDAFNKLPKSSMATGGENADCRVADALREALESGEADASFADWDSDCFDGIRAATKLEGYLIEMEDDE